MRNILIVMVATILMVGCGSKKKIVTKKRNASHRNERVVEKPKTETPSEVVVSTGNRGNYANATEAYIANYKSIAQEEMRKYKICEHNLGTGYFGIGVWARQAGC